jgi:hypothetical protein
MWFKDKINITLNHTDINIEEPWTPQWENNYKFNINKTGLFKLAFLLYTEPTEKFVIDYDYKEIANEKIDYLNSTAYRTLHLWITVNQ